MLNLLYFTADWCLPCKTYKPRFQKIAGSLDMKWVEIDVDQEVDISNEYGIMSVPTIVILEDGIEEDRLIGAFPDDRLRERLERFVR